MKVLLISGYFPPTDSIASRRSGAIAESLSAMGHQVTVATAQLPGQAPIEPSQYPFEVVVVESRILNLIGRFRKRKPKPSVARNHSYSSFRLRTGVLTLGRLPDLWDVFLRPTLRQLKHRQFDVVMSSFAPRYAHAVAYQLKTRGAAALWVADFRDLWTNHHQFTGIPVLREYESHLEEKYVAKADCVTTVSKGLVNELKERHPRAHVRLVRNGITRFERHCSAPSSAATTRLVYTGSIYPGWESFPNFLRGADSWVKANPQARPVEIDFYGNDLCSLQQWVNEQNFSLTVNFHGNVSHEEALRRQSEADVLLLFQPDTRTDIPTGKLYEYIGAGTQIWCVGPQAQTEAGDIIQKTATGKLVSTDPQSVCAAFTVLGETTGRPSIAPDIAELNNYESQTIFTNFFDSIESELGARQNGSA